MLPNPADGYWYGGATKVVDAAKVAYLGGIAARERLPQGDPARFRFEVHRIGPDGSLTRLLLEDGNQSGTGGLYVNRADGSGRYYCVNGKSSFDGPIPGFVPFTGTTTMSPPPVNNTEIAALRAAVTGLQAQVSAVATSDKAAVNRLSDRVSKLPIGVSRDEAWKIAADRAFVEVTTEGTGVRTAIKALVQPVNLVPIVEKLMKLEADVTALSDAQVTPEAVKSLATGVLVSAIDYAKGLPREAAGSRLRSLVEWIVKGN